MASVSRSKIAGHLFIINGDIAKLQCDAVLVPTDYKTSVTTGFKPLVASSAVQAQLRGLEKRKWKYGEVVRLRQRASGPQVWVGHLGGTDRTPVEDFVDCAKRFIEKAALELRGRETPGVLPQIALPVVGTGRGGGVAHRGDVLRALIPALLGASAQHHVDIVLVAYGRVMFDAAQQVRREELARRHSSASRGHTPWDVLGARGRQAAESLAQHARRGDLVVFVGAGVSASAGLPAWQRLLDDVARELGLDDRAVAEMHQLDVRDQASLLGTHDRFRSVVTAALSAGRYSLTHGLLVSLPVREFVTTNFDQLLETAAKSPGNSLEVVPGGPVRSSSRVLVKLHGTLGKDLVLTRAEYRDVKSRQGALFGLLQALLITKHMLFVGYSLKDEDFNDVMHDVRQLRTLSAGGTRKRDAAKPYGTVLTDFESKQFAELWKDLSVVSAQGARPLVGKAVVPPTARDWAEVTRKQALLIDLVALQSASDVGFVTDPSLSSVGGVAGDELAALVHQLRALYSRYGDSSDGRWREVRALLDAFAFADSENVGRRL